MFLSEAHNLAVGQSFVFTETGISHQVTDIDVVDYEGNSLVLYTSDDGLHGHHRDHTPVWIL